MSEHINPHYQEQILRALEYHFPEAKVILFGSRARKTHAQGADVDIAVDCGNKIPIREITRARITLENLPISLTVDLVDFHNIPKILQETILNEGVLWKNSSFNGK